MQPLDNRLVIHAPNIHTGGGLVLLRALLQLETLPLRMAFLDMRFMPHMPKISGAKFTYVQCSLIARLGAELRLWLSARSEDTLLCFHGLPPLLPYKGSVVVFLQNRLLIESRSLAGYPLPVRIRLWLERVWCRLLQRHCSLYIVQTPSMAALLKNWLRRDVPVAVVPFAPLESIQSSTANISDGCKFDFVYVSSGEAHKNHRNLVEAWRLLAVSGYRPSLALTLDTQAYPELDAHISQVATEHALRITNLGLLSKEVLNGLYQSVSAMVYPSMTESFGLPLIEAAKRGLPIIAPELDYVRDVVNPTETFDPSSPVSIARAVRRFLFVVEKPLEVRAVDAFLDEVLR